MIARHFFSSQRLTSSFHLPRKPRITSGNGFGGGTGRGRAVRRIIAATATPAACAVASTESSFVLPLFGS